MSEDLCDTSKLTFTLQGNCVDKNSNYLPIDVLYKAYKDSIGEEFNCDDFDGKTRIITDVTKQNDFIFVDTIIKEEGN